MQKQLAKKGNEKLCPVAVMVRNNCLLMGHRHYTPDKWKEISVWTCPGGRCDAGENIEQALRREVDEETGINDLEILEYIGEARGAKEGDIVPLFFCQTQQEPKLMEPEKFSEWRWVDMSDYLEGTLGVFNPHARDLIINFLQKSK